MEPGPGLVPCCCCCQDCLLNVCGCTADCPGDGPDVLTCCTASAPPKVDAPAEAPTEEPTEALSPAPAAAAAPEPTGADAWGPPAGWTPESALDRLLGTRSAVSVAATISETIVVRP
jgi:hypothetical protein